MTPKQQRFVAEYLIDLNATQAAIRAGYSAKTAKGIGSENLTKPDIAAAVSAGKAEQLQGAGLSAAKVLERIGALAFQDVRDFFDTDGNLLPVRQLSDKAAACVASFEVVKKNAAAGDGIIDTVHKVRTVDAVKNLEMLAKHFALLTERVEHRGDINLRWASD